MPARSALARWKAPLEKHAFASLMAANFCFFMGFATFFLLPKYLITVLGAREGQVGAIMAGYGLVMVACLPAIGVGSDRYGRRPFLILGAVLLGATALAFVTVQELGPWPYLLRGLQGLAFACWFVNSSTLAVDVVDPAHRGSALGLFGVSTLITYGLAPALAEWIAHDRGFALVFLLALAWSGLALLLSLVLPTPAPHPTRLKTGVSRSWRQLASEPIIGAICIGALLMGLAFGTVLVFSQAQALARGITPVTILTLAFALTSIIIRLGFSRLADGGGKRAVLILSLLAMAAGTGLLAAVNGIGLYALCGVLIGVGHSLAYPTLNVMLINHLPPHEHGRGMSLFVAAFNVGTILAQFGLGLLIFIVGLHGIFLIAALLAVAAIAPILRATAAPQ